MEGKVPILYSNAPYVLNLPQNFILKLCNHLLSHLHNPGMADNRTQYPLVNLGDVHIVNDCIYNHRYEFHNI